MSAAQAQDALRTLPHFAARFIGALSIGALLAALTSCHQPTSSDTASASVERADGAAKENNETAPVRQPAGPGSILPINRNTESGGYQIRQFIDTSGFGLMQTRVRPWAPGASLEEIADIWRGAGLIEVQAVDEAIADGVSKDREVRLTIHKAACYGFEGKTREASDTLAELRRRLESDLPLAKAWLYSVIYFQGVFALRQGEDENCILCRGESSCILPISAAAVHVNPAGSRKAIGYFLEYLERFPDDTEAKWLLNIAFMTLGEFPAKVPKEYLFPLDAWANSEFDIGVFRDVGHLVGLNRLNISGGAIMEDFNSDGRFDVAFTNWYPTEPMAVFTNDGQGKFEDRSEAAGVLNQLGGLNCVQTDFNNDGRIDIYIPRGAWVALPMRPTLLRNDGPVRNDGDCQFTDVTAEAGLLEPLNSIAAQWADYDNDGWLDLFVCCERQPNRLYRNRGDGTFEEVAEKLGIAGREFADANGHSLCKGVAWIDYDNDDFPDLFINHLSQVGGKLFRNNGGQSFVDVSHTLGIDGPKNGFACWAFDYDNDGWLDIFSTSYFVPMEEIVRGIAGEAPDRPSNKLFRNLRGELFQDVTKQAGLDMFFATMGSNFGDFDNDGWLDMYLGTGDPNFATLVPNRMFKNVAGKRFAEITASSRTGNLQKGHGVGCGDWDRDGDVDIFIQMGGAIPGDAYHNILLQNPGQGNHWLSVKLIGQKTNRSAIGARLKATIAIEPSGEPSIIHRHVSSGSSFGASPLEQHLGLGKATSVAELEVHWPTSGTTQTFHDIPADRQIEITEFADTYRTIEHEPVALPGDKQ